MQISLMKQKYNSISEPVKASVWYMICNILNKGMALISTPIFTRILTEEQYGLFSIFQSWYSIIIIFTSLNIFLGGYTKGLLIYKNDWKAFTSALLSLTTLITCCFGIIYCINSTLFSSFFGIPEVLMPAMFLELLFMPALEFWSAAERFDFKYQKYVIVSLMMTGCSLLCGVLAVLNTEYKVEAKIYSDAIVKVLFCSVIFVFLIKQGKRLYVKKYWCYALRFNVPLLPHYLSNYVLSQSDRIMIGRMVGTSQAAYYSIAYTISMMMNIIITAINNSLSPYIYKSINAGNAEVIKKAVTPICLIVGGLSVLTMAFAPEVIYIFAGSKYSEAIYVIPPIAAAVFFIFLYSMFSTVEYFYQKTGYIAVATCASAVLNLALNYVFISLFGYYAAGYTTLICYILLTYTHYFFYRRVLKDELPNVDNLYDIRMIILTSGTVLIVMFVMLAIYGFIIVRYSIILIMLITLIIKKRTIVDSINSIRKE